MSDTPRTHKRIASLLAAALLGLGLQAAVAAPAQASPWTWLHTHAGGGLAACKTPVDSPYGPLWKVHVRLINVNSNHLHNGGVKVVRGPNWSNGQVVHSWNRSVPAYGQSDIGTVYLSRILPDTLVAGFGEPNGNGAGGDVGMAYIAGC